VKRIFVGSVALSARNYNACFVKAECGRILSFGGEHLQVGKLFPDEVHFLREPLDGID